MKGINCRKKTQHGCQTNKKNANPFYWDFFPSNNFIHWNIEKKQQQQMSSDQYKFYLDRIDDDIYHALLNDDDNYE